MRNRLQLVMALAVTLTSAVPAQVSEYQVKAALLYKFAQFVTWPPEAFSSPSDPIIACVLGQPSLAFILSDVTKTKTVGDRPFTVRGVDEVQQARACHVLFIGSVQRKNFRSILNDLIVSPILTVADDIDGFTENGGVVSFTTERGTVHFKINLTAAKQKNLLLSSKLLSLARIVK